MQYEGDIRISPGSEVIYSTPDGYEIATVASVDTDNELLECSGIPGAFRMQSIVAVSVPYSTELGDISGGRLLVYEGGQEDGTDHRLAQVREVHKSEIEEKETLFDCRGVPGVLRESDVLAICVFTDEVDIELISWTG